MERDEAGKIHNENLIREAVDNNIGALLLPYVKAHKLSLEEIEAMMVLVELYELPPKGSGNQLAIVKVGDKDIAVGAIMQQDGAIHVSNYNID